MIIKKFESFNESLYTKGDKVELKMAIEEDPTDGEFAYSIDKGEVGEIRYEVGDMGEIPGREENIVYMVRFPDKAGKRRLVQLTKQSLNPHNS